MKLLRIPPQPRRSRGFLLVSVMLILMVLFILMFSLMTLSEQRTRLVKANSDRTVLSAEARAGLAEAAHYLDGVPNWADAATGIPSTEASLNTETGAFRKLEVLSATATEVRVRSTAYLKDGAGNPTLSRKLEATFRRVGAGFPSAAIYGASGATLNSNAVTDSYDSTQGTYEQTLGSNGDIGSNAIVGTPITLDPNAQVNGDLVIQDGTTPDIAGNAQYDAINVLTEPEPLPAATPPSSLASAPSLGDVVVTSDMTLTPGRYSNVMVGADGKGGKGGGGGNVTLTLQGGDYLVDNLEMFANSQIQVVNGPVRVYFRESLDLNSNTLLATDGAVEDSTQLQLVGDSTAPEDPTVILRSNCSLVGVIYNPTGPVVMEQNSEIWGGIVGDTVTLGSNALAHFDRAALGVQVSDNPEDLTPEISSWESW